MACFVAPLVQAIATTAYRKFGARRPGNVWTASLPTLEKMLWGGSIMLIIDHILNGELVWRFPFFTALGKAGGGEVMLREILTVGIPMCVAVTLVWALIVLVSARKKTAAV